MSKFEDPEELKTICDHIDLLANLLTCCQELPQSNSEVATVELEVNKMIANVVRSMKLRTDYIIRRSAKYHKNPKLHKRIKDSIEDWREKRRQRKFEDAQYKSYLEWQKSMFEKESPEPAEPPQDAAAGLPVCQPATSVEVVDEERQQD